MAKRAWTKEQTAAFTTRDRTLLISAAAGSGKTATLTERIIRSILDEDNPHDIGSMLIVTFTNLAVGELRERISAAIRHAAEENPESARLEEQLLRVKDAKICTINSFCNDILRISAEDVGLCPNYRIAEGAEAAIIADGILTGMINSAYEGRLPEVASAEDFSTLAEGLTAVNAEGELGDYFKYIYDKLGCEAEGISLLSRLVEEYNPEVLKGPDSFRPYKYIKERFREALQYFRTRLSEYSEELSADEKSQKTAAVFEADIRIIENTLAKESYSELYSYMRDAELLSMVSSKAEVYKEAKGVRDDFVKMYKKYRDEYFSISEDNLTVLTSKIYKNGKIIVKFLKKYDEAFLEEKRRRGIVEFRDAERYAYMALYDKEGEPTPLALEIRKKYSDIYIDEYQDVNALQAKVFEAISRPDNCFMVGDIKQSIYGFRSAKPEFFRDKKNSYPPLGSEGDYPKASIFMSSNFRCDENIINFTNECFDKLFGVLGESIGYVREDRLGFGKIYNSEAGEKPLGHIPEIHLIEKKRRGAPREDESGEEFAEAAETEEISAIERSAAIVAQTVSSLVGKERLANGEYIKPADIAILIRSVKEAEGIYSEALKKYGYDCEVSDSGEFFYSEEVLLALSLLNVIDNPLRDVHLMALMTSPLYGFSFDEVLLIRRNSPSGTLYDSLKGYLEKYPEYEKGERLLRDIRRYRRLSEGMSVDMLISMLYRESGLLSLAEAYGGRENLMLLHGYARKYEESSFKGLYSFISYINNVIERGETIDFGQDGEALDENKVKIFTFHRSKGLEFPVTILAECGKSISIAERGPGARIKLAPDFGFSLGVRDDSGLAMLDNPPSRIISAYMKDGEYEESLRVLYVALTRARERLYIFGGVDDIDAALDSARLKRESFSSYTARSFKSILEMLLVTSRGGTVIPHYEDAAEPSEALSFASSSPAAENEDAAPMAPKEPREKAAELISRFNYRYHSEHLTTVPGKLSVSRLTPTVLDGSEKEPLELSLDGAIERRENNISGERGVPKFPALYRVDKTTVEAALAEKKEEKEPEKKSATRYKLTLNDIPFEIPSDFEERPTLPSFISGRAADESARRGIATHTFMQFCDFENLTRCGAEAELRRLVEREFISEADALRVRKNEIEAFVSSALFSEMRRAKRLERELRFNTKLPAEKFTSDEKRRRALEGSFILVQGVIDCIIEDESGALHLVDYKTDRMSDEELNNPALADKALRDKHSLQLSYYREAVKRIFGRAPEKIGIYSMHLGREIEVLI